MIRGPIDGKYVELWGIPAWRRKLGIGDESETLTQRIETIVAANGGPDIGIGSVDNANARLAAFATLEEAGYVVQTSTFPPAFAGRQIVGVPNRINVTNGTGINGNTVLQTPQDIDSGATPSFQTIKPTLLTNDYVTYVNPSGELASTTITAAQLSTAVASAAAMDILTTRGDLLSHDGTTYIRVGIGAANTVARTDGLDVLWGKVVLTTDVSGVLPTANGGTNNATWTAGSVIFAGAGGTSLTEDNANLFWDDANNRLGVGTAVPVTELTVVSMSASDPRGIMSAQYSSDAVGARIHFRKARGTDALPTTVVTGDVLGRIRFSGYDGANHLQMASIDAVTFGTIAATRVPVDLVFSTATDLAPSVLTERMRVKGAGGVQIPRDTSFMSITAGSALVILAQYTSAAGENLLGSVVNANKTHIGSTGFLTVLGSGFVGAGTATPLVKLHAATNDAVTAAVTDVIRLHHSSTGAPAANFGTGLHFTGESSTTDNSDMARIQTIWTDSTHATRTSSLQFQVVNSAAALATRMSLSGAGGLSVGDATTTTAVGVINAVTGYRVASGAATSGTYLRGNGTNFVSSSLVMTDASGVLPIANGGTNASSFAATNGVVYFDGTSLVNSADLLYTPSALTSRGTSLNGINAPYIAANLNTGANAGSEYDAVLADTSNNQIIAGYIAWFKEQSWTTVAATQDSSATIGTTLNGATIAALLLHSSGSVVCGKDSTLNTRTDDFTYICQTNGVPTGVPTAFGNRVAMTFDPNTDTFYIYRGGWKGVVVV